MAFKNSFSDVIEKFLIPLILLPSMLNWTTTDGTSSYCGQITRSEYNSNLILEILSDNFY